MSLMSAQPATRAGLSQLPVPADPKSADLLRYASLLCGLWPEVGKVIARPDWPHSGSAAEGRTCIDAGSSLMFSLLAPGGRSLRVLSRLGPPSGGVISWRRYNQRAGEPVEGWRSESYLGEPQDVWERVEAIARGAGGLARLRRTHAILGPRGRIFSLSYRLDGRMEATVSWQLDRHFGLDEALELLGFKGAWKAAAGIWEDLLGFPASLHTGPWSILIPLHETQSRLRIGSTNWARRAEDPEKRRRLAMLVEGLGGDGRYADALYKLLTAAVRTGGRPAIGRAVEVELLGDQLVGAEFFLCMP